MNKDPTEFSYGSGCGAVYAYFGIQLDGHSRFSTDLAVGLMLNIIPRYPMFSKVDGYFKGVVEARTLAEQRARQLEVRGCIFGLGGKLSHTMDFGPTKTYFDSQTLVPAKATSLAEYHTHPIDASLYGFFQTDVAGIRAIAEICQCNYQ